MSNLKGSLKNNRTHMSANEKTIKSAIEELIENGNFEIVNTLFAVDYLVHAGNKKYTGQEFVKKWASQIRSAIPDIKIEKIVILNQTLDTIAWQRTLKGTHKFRFMRIQPTGQRIKWNEIVVSRFENNQIKEEWVVSELAGYLLSKPPLKK